MNRLDSRGRVRRNAGAHRNSDRLWFPSCRPMGTFQRGTGTSCPQWNLAARYQMSCRFDSSSCLPTDTTRPGRQPRWVLRLEAAPRAARRTRPEALTTHRIVARVLSLRPPTAVSHRFRLAHVAPLGFGLVVEVSARDVVNARLAGMGGEVALDRVSEWARPSALRRDAGLSGLRGWGQVCQQEARRQEQSDCEIPHSRAPLQRV